jgi:hypothetical protein
MKYQQRNVLFYKLYSHGRGGVAAPTPTPLYQKEGRGFRQSINLGHTPGWLVVNQTESGVGVFSSAWLLIMINQRL